MRTFLQGLVLCCALVLPAGLLAQQVTNADFEDWSAPAFNDCPQATGWNASNVEQVGLKFNFAHKEAGHGSGYCMMVQDQEVGIENLASETSPGYFSLGQPWAYLPSVMQIGKATAGTYGGVNWKFRPDSMSVWIKRTGTDWAKEDFYLLYYAWSGTAKGDKYKNKDKGCTSVSYTNEESDIRQALNGNECGTSQKATQIAEGMWRERKQYSQWTKITVPIYYMEDAAPTMMNIIFSASNYPNFRANDGLYVGNSLYVDDVKMVYASTIQKLYIGDVEWKGFDPTSTEVQVYSLGESASSIPSIEAIRGAGAITNAHGTTVSFKGRKLQSSEMSIVKGDLESTPTRITVQSEDGSSTTTYQIQFRKAASSNAKLASIALNGEALAGFSPTKYNYTVELPYGTTTVPVVTAEGQEAKQTVEITQAASVTGTAKIVVTAPNGTTKSTYNLTFKVGLLADNTLQDIKVNGKSVPGFTPTQAIYKVSLPVSTTQMPVVEAVSAYPAGEQTIVYTAPDVIDGGTYLVSVTTPGNSVAKVYKLNFRLEASSYTWLQYLQVTDANGTEYITDFAPEKTTYYVRLPLGTTTMPTITYTRGDEYQTVQIAEGGIDGITRVTVTAGNGDQAVYKINFSTRKSDNSSLSGILIGGEPLEGFDPEQTAYTVTLPIGTTVLPEISVLPGDEYQQPPVITTAGVNGTTRITVTAGDGSITIYQIAFKVESFTDNTLKSLSVEGYSLQDAHYEAVAFDPQVTEYWVKLNTDATALPQVHIELQNAQYQDTTVRRPSGLNGDYKITVRPLNGSSRQYVIHFVFKQSDNTALQMIYLDGAPLEGFAPDQTDYTVTLAAGTTVLPEVTAAPSEASQDVSVAWDNRTARITVKAQSGAKRVYKIKFIIPSAAGAQLEMIYVGGEELPGYQKDVLEYTYALKTATCPAITVKKAEGQQVTIAAPYAAGKASIVVKSEQGEESTYIIDFVAAAVETARLNDIVIDGQSLAGLGLFESGRLQYEWQYRNKLPQVEGEAVDTSCTVRVLWKGDVASINVTDRHGNTTVYTVACIRVLSGDNTLEGLYADGELIEGFQAEQLEYVFTLQPGSTYPVVSYKAKDHTQVIFFGQLAEGKWGVTVEAEDGTPATYTVQYTILPYDDATLAMLYADGEPVEGFAPDRWEYALVIDEGAELPALTVSAREGQTILQQNVSDAQQQVIVYAESGAHHTYTITYTRTLSNNALLADILIDGVSLEGFDANTFQYIDSLDRLNEDLQRTRVIPNVFPIGQLENQTITTYYSRPNGTTRIQVTAQDGSEANYYIAFPVRQSANNQLKEIELTSEYDDVYLDFKPAVTDYVITMPYKATGCPQISITKGEEEQRVDIVSRPLGDTTQVTVYAENGAPRTYNILFRREVLKTKNQLAALRITELNEDLLKADKSRRDFAVTMPYGSRSLTVAYEKAYDEQTVFVQPGGVYHPTVITVKANNENVPDEVYTITPTVATQNPAVLEGITINGTPLEGFEMNRFSYVVLIDSKEPAQPVVLPQAYDGATATPTVVNSKHWQAMVSKNGFTNTYDLWFYYTQDVIPNADFTNWTKAANNDAPKPTGWNCIADYATKFDGPASGTHTFGANEEVVQVTVSGSNKGVQLNSKESAHEGNIWAGIYGGALGGILPAMITLGTITPNLQVAAGSTFNVTGGITFRNTPDFMKVRASTGDVSGNNRIVYQLSGSGSKEKVFSTDANTGYKEYSFDLSDVNSVVGAPSQMNIILNSLYKESVSTLTDGNEATMTVDWLRFTFNHTLTGLKVDNVNAALSGKAFTAVLNDAERIETPVLAFTGEVSDQAQEITWKDTTFDADYEIRTADIRNWAENGVDYTDYTLTVKRPLDSVSTLQDLLIDGAPITAFAADKSSYTVLLPSHSFRLPDVRPVAASSLQDITTAFDETDSTMTISVTAEKGQQRTYTLKFTTQLSDDTRLANITAEGLTFDAETRDYTLEAEWLPLITFTKLTDRQTVSLVNGVLTVTAENGAQGVYNITRVDPTQTTDGLIKEFIVGTQQLDDLGLDKTDKQAKKPAEAVFFTRNFDRDSVVFVQSATRMEWHVYGTEGTTAYTWTYPQSVSNNADLADITLNGVSDEHFNASTSSYNYTSDSTIVVAFVAAEAVQKLETEVVEADGHITYTTTVTAESGAQKTYTVTISRPLSTVSTLAGILLDGELLDGFDPEQKEYTVVLPLPADGIKREQPKMPSLTYLAGQQGQVITVEPGSVNGDETQITVRSEDGDATHVSEYTVLVTAEPSHCADLTGITVNGVAIQGDTDEQFEPGRHYYSLFLKTKQIEVDYASADCFQTVTVTATELEEDAKYRYVLHVVAEDGYTQTDYQLNIYVENKSSDDQLANILLDGKPFEQFEPAYNKDLVFNAGQNSYKINLAPGMQTLPEVNAVLKMDGQTVDVHYAGADSVVLTVTAVAGNTNDYVLHFLTPLSTNTNLRAVEADNELIAGFMADKYFYSFDLQEGAAFPNITVETEDENARYEKSVTETPTGTTVTITVTAEDPTYTATYTILYHFIKSDITALELIMEDGRNLQGFAPEVYYYAFQLPVGTTVFPVLDYETAEEHQTVRIDTVSGDALSLVRQIVVEAQNGNTATYTVAYTILQSAVDTLQMILVERMPLQDFKASQYEYYYQLTAQEAAERTDTMLVEPLAGDEYQTVKTVHVAEQQTGKSLGYKTVITATAPTGAERIYTIHYPVALSDEAALAMIYLGGEPLSGFDEERFSYRAEIGQNEPVPAVTVDKKERAQTVDITIAENVVSVVVTAEDGVNTRAYTLTFERRKSAETNLKEIILTRADGTRLSSADFPYRPDYYEYTVSLPFDGERTIAEQLPELTYVKYEEEQTVTTQLHELPNGDAQIVVAVTAPNGEDEGEYALTFRFLKPSDAKLLDIRLGGVSLADFDALTTDYTYVHPFGATTADFFTLEDVTYVLSDELATAATTIDEEGTIAITVTAQNGEDEITYFIRQTVALDGDNYLKTIELDGKQISGFDPEETFYTYYVVEGKNTPLVTAEAQSANADVSIREVSAGDTCLIIVTAQDQSVRYYRIHFAISTSDAAQTPTSNDVLVKRIPGAAQLFAATLRNDVSFALYDYNGHLVYYYQRIPVADPNDADIRRDAENREVLNNVSNLSSGIVVDVVPGQIYFYTFFVSDEKILKSGKIMLMP